MGMKIKTEMRHHYTVSWKTYIKNIKNLNTEKDVEQPELIKIAGLENAVSY